ncbi:hypothetical protein CWI38_1602p0020 [Hamiltosporidium tvaerminnensis]|uniref:Uncharacterized protein n=1 Tax=Hamiltosporidium tvaerminnensis TaxID=1176355 RepID=A0A4Q9LSZ4_9MICR|nr:hypothetical protein CWI38_1602p0020 [Hamiltosporidium tvaerminnensis]
MTNILNDILKYQIGNTLPDISILMKYDYFFNNILCQEQLEILFFDIFKID